MSRWICLQNIMKSIQKFYRSIWHRASAQPYLAKGYEMNFFCFSEPEGTSPVNKWKGTWSFFSLFYRRKICIIGLKRVNEHLDVLLLSSLRLEFTLWNSSGTRVFIWFTRNPSVYIKTKLPICLWHQLKMYIWSP